MRKLSLDKLDLFFKAIAEKMELFLPVDGEDGSAAFTKYYDGVKWSSALNTVRSAKDFFFPQTEDLMKFCTEGKNIEITDLREEMKDFAVFGVRACDCKSFDILDTVFLTEPRDSFYASKREHGIIITVACSKPSETCFCTVFGIDPAEPMGDISCWKTESELFLQENTEKGKALLDALCDLTEQADSTAVESQKEKIAAITKKLPLADLPVDSFGGGKTMEFFNRPEWAELSETCLGCGTCTFVCPTCQCYDIKDFTSGNSVLRYRCWDSCMYSEFTKMAHGNNRLSQKERFRQRFMHKLVYYPENNGGVMGCVGCGRCLAKCPISMNIAKVMRKLGGETNE